MSQPLYPPGDPRARQQPYQAQPYPAQPAGQIPEARLVTPATPVQPAQVVPQQEESESEIDDRAIHYELQNVFAGTRPWLWFLGIVGFLIGLSTIGGVLFMLYLSQGKLLPIVVILFLSFMVSGGVLMLSAYQLFRYASQIGEYLLDPTRYWLERTLNTQRSVWKSLSLLMLLGIVLTVLLMVAMFLGVLLDPQTMTGGTPM